MFTTATNEKAVVASRIGELLDIIEPGPRALRIFDAGMGDATVLSHLMRQMHNVFMHIPWLIVGKEISIEDVRLALDRMPDRFHEHPEMVVVITNMHYREAPSLEPLDNTEDVDWQEVALQGSTTEDFAHQIRQMSRELAEPWAVRTSPKTGNPLYVRPAVRVLYRNDRRFLLNEIIPRQGHVEGSYDLVIASQPYRARTSTEHKVKTVLVPLTRALAPGGRLVGVHSHGNDPGLEIVREVWPDEDPFVTSRHDLAETFRILGQDPELVFEELDDAEAIFQYQLHAMPSELKEHIGTSLVMAAWNAAAYVAQIDEDRLSDALSSGAYVAATSDVIRRRGGVWFNDELYIVSRKSDPLKSPDASGFHAQSMS
jgi:hypothetical protein